MTAEIFVGAYIIDILIGDPRWCPHPVVIMGKGISYLERVIRKYFSRGHLKTGGVILWFVVVLITYFVTWGIVAVTLRLHFLLGTAAMVLLASLTLATRSLYQESRIVMDHLNSGHIEEARRSLSMIVGRDTANLDEAGIMRAVIETVSENLSDGIIAPMFYLGLGGVPLAMTYKAVNTLDSMIGYKSDLYKDIGYFSAGMDDIFNWIPARVTGLAIVLTSFLLGLNWKNAWKIMRRDGRNHPSPNSGIPEAAVAGALGIQLGGKISYFGKIACKPAIGDRLKETDKKDVKKAWAIMFTSSLLMAVICITTLGIIKQ
jgi:adenosylcobinamide-phosphate synthase